MTKLATPPTASEPYVADAPSFSTSSRPTAMAGMVFTSTKRPPIRRAGTDTWRRPLMRTSVREAPRPRRLTLATFSVSVDGWLELYQLFRSPTTPWLTFRFRKRSTSCVAPVCSSISRLTTVTAWGMLMAGASMAVPVTVTFTSSKSPPSCRSASTVAMSPAASSTSRSRRSNPASVNVMK